jgi:hypothetical protein
MVISPLFENELPALNAKTEGGWVLGQTGMVGGKIRYEFVPRRGTYLD